jgi:hypothetical protein
MVVWRLDVWLFGCLALWLFEKVNIFEKGNNFKNKNKLYKNE